VGGAEGPESYKAGGGQEVRLEGVSVGTVVFMVSGE